MDSTVDAAGMSRYVTIRAVSALPRELFGDRVDNRMGTFPLRGTSCSASLRLVILFRLSVCGKHVIDDSRIARIAGKEAPLVTAFTAWPNSNAANAHIARLPQSSRGQPGTPAPAVASFK